MPCDVAALVSAKCLYCHGAPLTNSAPMPLLERSHFTSASTIDPDATFGARSVLRMKQTAAPMPPSNAPAVTADELALFEAWVNDGMKAGTCETNPDAGLPVDAGPPPLTCLSGEKKPKPTTAVPGGGADMAPGWACSSCHQGKNFEGQNPFGALGMTPSYDAMGTVYASANEEDLCVSTVPSDAGIRVEIVDSTGALVISTPVVASGNFYGSVPMDAGIRMPYTARVVQGSKSRVMMTAQTLGDCNQCHTAYGREGAPGRILAP